QARSPCEPVYAAAASSPRQPSQAAPARQQPLRRSLHKRRRNQSESSDDPRRYDRAARRTARSLFPRRAHESTLDAELNDFGAQLAMLGLAHLKRILRLGRLRLRGPRGAQFEFTLAAIAQNLRRSAKLVARPPPLAAACVA